MTSTSHVFSQDPQDVPFVTTEHRSIKTSIPAIGTRELLGRLGAVESRSMHGQLPIVWDDAVGASVYDALGNKFIDFTSSIFVANVGHSNNAVRHAIESRVWNKTIHSYTFPTEIRTEYLERLTQWSGFDKAFLLSSGTEATECALKLMRMYGANNNQGVVCLDGAFHGRTMGAHMMSGGHDWAAEDENIYVIKPGRDPFPHDICGFMIETYQGWSAQFHDQALISEIAQYCKETGALLCFDEMQSGFARTGRKFGYEHYGVKPDLICVGKGMGNGVPLSGVLGRADILDLPEAGSMSSTHSANPLVCAAGLAVIEEIERLDLVREAERKGERMFRYMADWPYKVMGKGLVAAVHLPSPEFASKVAERCMQKGLLVVHTGRETVKIGPPLTIPDDALMEGLSVLKQAIGEIENEKMVSS
jgi:4-aminobutyrate aminotransferase-like enzyme